MEDKKQLKKNNNKHSGNSKVVLTESEKKFVELYSEIIFTKSKNDLKNRLLNDELKKKKINKLISDGDLLKVGIGDYAAVKFTHNDNFSRSFRMYLEDKKSGSYAYLVSVSVYNIFENIFDLKLKSYLEKELKEYRTETDNFFQFNTFSKQQREDYCVSEFTFINKRLRALHPGYLKDNNILNTQRQKWLADFSFKFINGLIWLKFDLYNGGVIDGTADLSTVVNSILFRTAEEKTNFEIILLTKKIDFLKTLGNKLDRSDGKSNDDINSLQELFIDADYYTDAINVLIENSCIDYENRNIMGTKLKGGINAWIKVLRKRKQLKSINDAQLVKLLNAHFPGLNLSEKTEGKILRSSLSKLASKLESNFAAKLR